MARAAVEGLIYPKTAPRNRVGKHDGTHEHHFYEGAVMLAFALHLLHSNDTTEVLVHPDGMHGKQFPFRDWLRGQGFEKTSATGRTDYGGAYENALGERIVLNPSSGLGDVVCDGGGQTVVAEVKGGIVNSRHSGQRSKLYRTLCEAVGLLMSRPLGNERQIAVVPDTDVSRRLARRMAPRCAFADIEIALVAPDGDVTYVIA